MRTSGILKGRDLYLSAISVGIALLIGFIDWITGPEISFSIFYLLPVAFASWYVSFISGVVMVAVCAAIWLSADLMVGTRYSHFLVPYWNMFMRGLMFLLVVIIHRLQKELLKKKELLNQDYMTKVGNWRYLDMVGLQELARARRNKVPLTMAYIDIDSFKAVNDSFGHKAGDALLVKMASTIKSHMRAIDCVARLGGDEFAVLMPETDHLGAKIVVERLHGWLRKVVESGGWPVTFSIGLVTFYDLPDSLSHMVKEADSLMYASKREGKNRIKTKVVGPPTTYRAQGKGSPRLSMPATTPKRECTAVF